MNRSKARYLHLKGPDLSFLYNVFMPFYDEYPWRTFYFCKVRKLYKLQILKKNFCQIQNIAYSIVITACHHACWWKVDCVIFFSERLVWKRLFKQKHYSQGAKKLPARTYLQNTWKTRGGTVAYQMNLTQS